MLKSHWVLVVMDQCTRRIIGFGVHGGDVDGPTLCRLFNEVISKQDLPRYISSDNDPLFLYHRWRANLRILGMEEVKSTPNVPISHPFVERIIGSIRRELLDQVFFWTSMDLERKLLDYQHYYNQHRTHTALMGRPPAPSSDEEGAELCHFRWQGHCHGLFELPMAA